MSTSTPGHGASTLKSSEAANARFESKSEDDDSMMSPSTTCGADGGRAGSFAEEIPASKSPKEPNRSSGSRQDLDRPIQRRSSTCSTRARSRSSSNERTRGDGDSLRQEIAQQIGKRDSSSHPSPTSLASSGEKQQRSSGNAVLPGLSGFASEDTVPAGIRERTEVSQHLFVALQQRPGIIDGDWIDKMSAEFNWWSLGMGATKRSHSSLDYRVQNRDDVRNVIVNLLDSLTISLRNCKNLGMLARAAKYQVDRINTTVQQIRQIWNRNNCMKQRWYWKRELQRTWLKTIRRTEMGSLMSRCTTSK